MIGAAWARSVSTTGLNINLNSSACYVVAAKTNMKVVIVGAGVAGLSTFLQLRKVLPSSSSNTIRIYEAHEPQGLSSSNGSGPSLSSSGNLTDTTAVIGNSIALVPSSIRLLKYIDARLYGLFKARGYENESYTFKTARGHRIAVTSTSDNVFPQEHTVSCPRYGLAECLREIVGDENIQYRRVIGVDLSADRPVVKFGDGGKEDADLVIGADGVRSSVKRALFGEDDERLYAPHYELVKSITPRYSELRSNLEDFAVLVLLCTLTSPRLSRSTRAWSSHLGPQVPLVTVPRPRNPSESSGGGLIGGPQMFQTATS